VFFVHVINKFCPVEMTEFVCSGALYMALIIYFIFARLWIVLAINLTEGNITKFMLINFLCHVLFLINTPLVLHLTGKVCPVVEI